jgi:hypothetical protein
LEDRLCLSDFSVVATGLENPRGLAFGPDGQLYVAEGGPSTNTMPPIAGAPQAPAPIGPYTGGYNGRISKIDPLSGTRTTVVSGLPSSQTSAASGGLVSGVSAVQFIGNTLYGMEAGAGSSHAIPDNGNPVYSDNTIFQVNPDGSTSLVTDLSTYLQANPVANPDPDDFEPDGTWYGMTATGGNLYVTEPNHQEVDMVTPSGQISRLIDISVLFPGNTSPAQWVGATGITSQGGNFYVGSLGTFPVTPGTESIYQITPSGQLSVAASGLTAVLGVAFDQQGRLFALESDTVPGFPGPAAAGTGQVVRVNPDGSLAIIASGLVFPTAMTFGPDGALYVSNFGFGVPDNPPSMPDPGQIVRIGAEQLNTFSVTNLADSGPGSLRQAVLYANASTSPTTINFAPGLTGTIALTSGPLSITNSMIITGPGASQIAVSGSNSSRVFDIASGVTAEIDDLTITQGMATQGGGIQNAGLLTLSQDVVLNNLATDTGTLGGGGILNLAGATLTLTNSTLSGNVTALVPTSLGLGGGLDNEGIATITACTIFGNQSERGAGVLNRGLLRVTNSTFTGNLAVGGAGNGVGGGLNNRDGGIASVLLSTFTDNLAVGVNFGGGGAIYNDSFLTLTSVTVSGNRALGGDGADGINTFGQAAGGGIYDNIASTPAELILTNSVISNNLAQGGNAGNNNPNGSGNDTGVDLSGGGGIEYNGGVGSGLTILNCTITGNESFGGNVAQGVGGSGGGGGIFCQNFGSNLQDGKLTISGSTVAGNSALAGAGASGFRGGTALGGGMEIEGNPLLATSLTLANNSAIGGPGSAGAPGGTGFGGGIDLSFDTVVASLANCAVTGNLAQGGTGSTGANGGNGEGGGVALGAGGFFAPGVPDFSSVTLNGVLISGNQALGGAGGQGGNGGAGLGGGIYAGDVTTVTIQNTQIVGNVADGGASGGGSGQAGQGVGGGVYVSAQATVTADTLTIVVVNQASTSNDDVFGTITIVP